MTILTFFIVYYLFANVYYFEISLKINAFFLPILYVGTALWSVISYWRNHRIATFKEVFKRSFVPMFVGGIFSIFSIFVFLNFVDTDAKKLLNYQYVQRHKSELDSEYQKAKKILKNQEDIDDLDKKYQERLQSFSPKAVKNIDMLTAKWFSGYFAVILLFYMIISLFLGTFFRSKSR